MAKYNPNECLGKNAMRGVDVTEPEPDYNKDKENE